MMQEDREMALRKRALRNTETLREHTRQLSKLEVHDTVQIQNQIGHKASRWDLTGIVVEVKSYDQYLVRVHGSGRLTLRNRKFLKKIVPYGAPEFPAISPGINYDEKILKDGFERSNESDRLSPNQTDFQEPLDNELFLSKPYTSQNPLVEVPDQIG